LSNKIHTCQHLQGKIRNTMDPTIHIFLKFNVTLANQSDPNQSDPAQKPPGTWQWCWCPFQRKPELQGGDRMRRGKKQKVAPQYEDRHHRYCWGGSLLQSHVSSRKAGCVGLLLVVWIVDRRLPQQHPTCGRGVKTGSKSLLGWVHLSQAARPGTLLPCVDLLDPWGHFSEHMVGVSSPTVWGAPASSPGCMLQWTRRQRDGGSWATWCSPSGCARTGCYAVELCSSGCPRGGATVVQGVAGCAPGQHKR
jgi:hypothetical protein